VSLQISDTLDAQLETLEAVSVRYGGQEIGTVEVSTLSPTAVLPLTAPPGPVTVELSVNVSYVDGTSDVCTGQVTIQAYQGADYRVGWSHSGSSCVASLSERQSQQ